MTYSGNAKCKKCIPALFNDDPCKCQMCAKDYQFNLCAAMNNSIKEDWYTTKVQSQALQL